MNLAYFVNQYPKVSHSFIRREILALEARGIQVERFSLRSDQAELVDALDRDELSKTRYLLSAPYKIISSAIKALITNPAGFVKTFITALKLGCRSDRGVLRHCIYFLESCLLLEWQNKAQISHIHAHFGTNSTTVVMLAYLLGGSGYSFTVHGPEEFDKPEFIHLAEKMHHARFAVAISSFGRSQLWRLLPNAEWHKVKLVHCGLDQVFLGAKAKKPAAKGQFVCVGRLCEQKGQLLLLDAMKQLRDEDVACQLILAGDGPMRQDVENLISAYKLGNEVSITGWISGEQVKSLLLESNCMVLPSFAEGLPVVIMEALALGRPVISTYVAGIPELVEPGKNGWLVPAGDVTGLKNAMKTMLSTPAAELEAMGKRGHEAVLAQHNIEIEANKLAELFAGVKA
jgi:colanic acid/amylovoran biosynthesis glycosyltransferase